MINFFRTRLGLLAGMAVAIMLTAGAMISLASNGNVPQTAETTAQAVTAERLTK